MQDEVWAASWSETEAKRKSRGSVCRKKFEVFWRTRVEFVVGQGRVWTRGGGGEAMQPTVVPGDQRQMSAQNRLIQEMIVGGQRTVRRGRHRGCSGRQVMSIASDGGEWESGRERERGSKGTREYEWVDKSRNNEDSEYGRRRARARG